jgi:hypothetical protein
MEGVDALRFVIIKDALVVVIEEKAEHSAGHLRRGDRGLASAAALCVEQGGVAP